MSEAPKMSNLTRTLLSQTDQSSVDKYQNPPSYLESPSQGSHNKFIPSQSYEYNGSGSFQPYHDYMPSGHNTPNVVSSSYVSNHSHSSSLQPQFSSYPSYRPPVASPTTNISMETTTAPQPSMMGFAPHLSTSAIPVPQSLPSTSKITENPFAPQSLPLPQAALSAPDHYMTYHEYLSTLPGDEEHLNIVEYPVNDLILMLSSLLTKIIEANDKLHPNHFDNTIAARQRLKEERKSNGDTESINEEDDEMKNKYLANVLAFHGANVPGISLHAYLARVLKYCPVTNEVFLSLLVYFDRIAKKANNLQHKQEAEQLFVMDSYNIHRLIISGITVSSKFFSDIFYKNLRYAKVGGLPLDELNYLELQFLLLLDFKLMISVEDMQNYGDLLLKFWKRERVAKEFSPS
ncbi:hypothetical protein PGUG_00526 [Meyerozyma guilliermondii ATCC 6260]|uniref:Cyclin n=1 Tax=Meyerozyma guilliermondii (strain ATCC 6260 / CBS 566 / DSM 6381 / JCM 1539 / NBRC 10279 / NRRL Y-324) TaxID=294746 RepID=A5DB71_PICGU|nr:uncharacterized protein PGUG_00526 [Meyerozyma guilliermondii ATCC 6260]EDK36428.2 hypothetical protein PGUG_00526 [Meyerozyma guilliermondii ATCC 6260]